MSNGYMNVRDSMHFPNIEFEIATCNIEFLMILSPPETPTPFFAQVPSAPCLWPRVQLISSLRTLIGCSYFDSSHRRRVELKT